MRQNSRSFLAVAATAALCSFALMAQNPAGQSSSQSPAGASGGATSQPPPGASASPGASAEPAPMQIKMDDKKFLKDAAIGSMTEAELGKVASEKASTDAVKQFGQKMADEHSKAAEQLKQAAAQQKVSVPDSLDSKHQSRIDKLSKLSGAQFDQAYVKEQVKDHQQDVKEFQQEAQYGTDPNVKAVAVKMLPTLQEHLQAAKDLSKETTAHK